MSEKYSRRELLTGSAALAGAAALPLPAFADSPPLRLGLLTVKSGPLAQGGIQMEQGIEVFLKQKDHKLAGRKVELIVADTGGNPAGAKAKTQELIERDHVDIILGPLASFELLAIADYIIQAKMPLLAHAGTDEATQHKPNPYLVRHTPTSSQCMFPLADYAAKELKYKTAITIAEDFAFGYEQMGGFQRVFEDAGGRVLKKLWPPLVTADYTPYIAQIAGADAVVQGFAGSNPIKFMKQYADEGVRLPVLGGQAAGDDALLHSFGDEAVGMINACPYTADLDTPINKRFVADIVKVSGFIPGFYAADLYVHGMVVEAGLAKTGGRTDDREALIKALRSVVLTDTPCGPIRFDHFGNGICNIYIRRIEKAQGKLVNKTIKTYTDVSQFWTYDEKTYLASPGYARDYPPLKS